MLRKLNLFSIAILLALMGLVIPPVLTANTMYGTERELYDDEDPVNIMEENNETEDEEENNAAELVDCSDRDQPVYEVNPHDCGTYFACAGKFYVLMSCPEGLYFSNNNFRCDYPHNVQCAERSPSISKTV